MHIYLLTLPVGRRLRYKCIKEYARIFSQTVYAKQSLQNTSLRLSFGVGFGGGGEVVGVGRWLRGGRGGGRFGLKWDLWMRAFVWGEMILILTLTTGKLAIKQFSLQLCMQNGVIYIITWCLMKSSGIHNGFKME